MDVGVAVKNRMSLARHAGSPTKSSNAKGMAVTPPRPPLMVWMVKTVVPQ